MSRGRRGGGIRVQWLPRPREHRRQAPPVVSYPDAVDLDRNPLHEPCTFCHAKIGDPCRNGYGLLLQRQHDVRGGEIRTAHLMPRPDPEDPDDRP